jgi:phenol 2-monooxygenase
MPTLLLPAKGRYGLRDYEKMFCPDFKSGTDIFALRGIDRTAGCMIVVRPDQYVAHVLPLDAYRELAAYFDGFMVPQADAAAPRIAETAAA